MDSNKIPKPDDPTVKKVSVLLDYLAQNTTLPRKEIGDITTGAAEVVKKRYNKNYTHQQILEGGKRIIDAVPPEKRGKKEDFKNIAALIVIEAFAK